jgi:hypothetical protein
MLPALPTSTAVQPHGVPNCTRASVACVEDLARRQRATWEAWDATCDHRAVMGLAYLKITEALRDDLALPKPTLFRYPSWFEYVTAAFSNMWFAANADYDARRPVAAAWKIALDTMTKGDVTAGQEILLFSNAHVQHDLPFAYEQMGLRTRKGASRKPDHDAVNEINNRILDPTQDEVSQRYDPTFSWVDLKPSPLDELGSMEFVKSWREGAWRNAERLLRARTPAERQMVVDSIDATSEIWARFIAAPALPGFRATRDAYCRRNHTR